MLIFSLLPSTLNIFILNNDPLMNCLFLWYIHSTFSQLLDLTRSSTVMPAFSPHPQIYLHQCRFYLLLKTAISLIFTFSAFYLLTPLFPTPHLKAIVLIVHLVTVRCIHMHFKLLQRGMWIAVTRTPHSGVEGVTGICRCWFEGWGL